MNREEKIHQFLMLEDFGAYMERYAEFAVLPSSPEIFAKEMKLMETDDQYTHRQKETLRAKERQRVILSLRRKIDDLKEQLKKKGYRRAVLRKEPQVKVTYTYPNGRNGDIDHALALQAGRPKQTDEKTWLVRIPAAAYEPVELLSFYRYTLTGSYDPFTAEDDPCAAYLEKYNRYFAVERRMKMIHALNEKEFRNLRSVEDAELRNQLMAYHEEISRKRTAVYERLIMRGETNAKWQSEQTAYMIVKEMYPDAVFQYEARWLGSQKIDIYIPSKKTAIEYQGRQHSEAIDFFGGEEGLKNNARRDERKRQLCKRSGVKLLYWRYDEPLDRDYFIQNIAVHIERQEEEHGSRDS